MNDEEKARALERVAFTMHVHEAFVCLLWKRDRIPYAVGSGCLLLTGKRPVLLTARHNVFDPKTGERLPLPTLMNFEMTSLKPRKRDTGVLMAPAGKPVHRAVFRREGGTIRLALDDFGGQPHPHPDLDVALVECKPEHEGQLLNALQPKPLESTIANVDDVAQPGEELCAAGVPEEPTEMDEDAGRITLPTFVYFTNLRDPYDGQDERGLHLDWRVARDIHGGTLERPFSPPGMSGAPVWRQRLDRSQLFASAKGTQIVGVVSAMYPVHEPECDELCEDPTHEPEYVFCESVADFGPWLRDTAAKIAAGAK